MAYRAIHRYARISPRKARLVADMIRGKKIDEALTALQFAKQRAAWYFKAVLRSAVANAEEQDANVHNLYILESRVDQGPSLKRWRGIRALPRNARKTLATPSSTSNKRIS